MVNHNGTHSRHLAGATTARNQRHQQRGVRHHTTVSTRDLTIRARFTNITYNTDSIRRLDLTTKILITNRPCKRITKIIQHNFLHKVSRGARTHRMFQHNGALLQRQRFRHLGPIMVRTFSLDTLQHRMVNLTINNTPLLRMVRLLHKNMNQRF